MLETHKRTIALAVVWRIIATIITAIWTGLSSAILINVILTVLHYIHERVWLRVEWGKMNDN